MNPVKTLRWSVLAVTAALALSGCLNSDNVDSNTVTKTAQLEIQNNTSETSTGVALATANFDEPNDGETSLPVAVNF